MQPCARCSNRAFECKYPDVSNKPTASHGSKGVASSSNDEKVEAEESPYQQQPDRLSDVHITSPQHGPSPNLVVAASPAEYQPSNSTTTLQTPGDHLGPDNHLHDEPFGHGRRSFSFTKPALKPQTSESQNVEGLPFSPGAWDQNTLNSINWLPSGMSPNFDSNLSFGADFSNHAQTPGMFDFPSPRVFTHPNAFMSRTQVAPPGLDSSGPSRHWLDTVVPASEMEMQTPSANSQSTTGTGRFYVDGDGARLAKVKPQRKFMSRQSLLSPASTGAPSPRNTPLRYGFPALQHPVDGLGAVTFGKAHLMDHDTYAKIYQYFVEACTMQSPFHLPFETGNFPAFEVLDAFIHLYIEHFQPLFPMLHLPTLDLSRSHWLLSLALATIGSHFADIDNAEPCTFSLLEFLRRAISGLTETTDELHDLVTLSQIRLLSCIGMAYTGEEKFQQAACQQRNHLAAFCTSDWFKWDEDFQMSGGEDRESACRDWKRWKNIESRRRTGYAIWLVDCMWEYQLRSRPRLTLANAIVPLPCQEVLWEADSALQWRQVYEYSAPSPSLAEAARSIYIDKKLQPTMGEFSRILLIHALYQRSWEVENYFRQPLSRWTPTAERQDSTRLIPQTPVWLPGIPLFSRWRNSACDCLDILHWSANSVIGAASGMEHPTVLHLHLARVILLTPFRSICDLAYGLTNEDAYLARPPQVSNNRLVVSRWAKEDQHKARLAMIHAGVLFWHVRRYSASGFYEPNAVVLAALALWAYGTFAEKATSNLHDLDPDLQNEDELSYPTSINLDRPADDELVQTFIRRGDRMQAMVTGVGDVCSPWGPERVLNEGAKLAGALANWGVSRKGVRLLTELARVARGKGES